MPMIDELLTKLRETPPDTEEELRAMLDETGYDLVMKEPGGEEPLPEGFGEEEPPEGLEDEGLEGPPGEAADEGPPGEMGKLMGGILGGGPPSDEGRPLTPKRMSVLRIEAAGKALKPKKGGKR